MTLYREHPPGAFSIWDGTTRIGGVLYPSNIGQLWSAEDLALIKLFNPEEADAVPEGKVVTETKVRRIEGVVKYVHTLEDAPVYVPETPELYALATMTIEDEVVSAIVPSTKLAGGFRLDTGIYWVFFADPQPTTDYQVLCFNHASRVYVSERHEDFSSSLRRWMVCPSIRATSASRSQGSFNDGNHHG